MPACVVAGKRRTEQIEYADLRCMAHADGDVVIAGLCDELPEFTGERHGPVSPVWRLKT